MRGKRVATSAVALSPIGKGYKTDGKAIEDAIWGKVRGEALSKGDF